MLMDYTQKPGFLMKYKIQEGKNAPPDTKKTIKVCVHTGAKNPLFYPEIPLILVVQKCEFSIL